MTPIVELITIGREILDGRVIDTNAVFMAEALKKRGLVPRYAQRVDDDIQRIQEAFRIADSRSQVILVTGGLGPTSDDITAEAFAHFLGAPLEYKADALAQVTERLARAGRPVTDTQKKQAYLPVPCFVVPNPHGTAPGFGLERPGPEVWQQQWFFMPGVPREMKPMLSEAIAPRLPLVRGYRTHTWATQFTAEASLQDQLTPIEKALPAGFEVTYRTRFPENHIGLHGDCASPERQAEFERLQAEITRLLGDDCFAHSGDALPSLEETVVNQLLSSNALVATVESCTGGLLANRLTDVSGSSEAFWTGFVAYDNESKRDLGVPAAMLKAHGAVSKEVAIEMAKGGLARLTHLYKKRESEGRLKPGSRAGEGGLYCLSTTGIAGPTGATADKPVGLCHIALVASDGTVLHQELQGRNTLDRPLMKLFFAQKTLDLLRRALIRQGPPSNDP